MMFSATLSTDIRPVCKKFMRDVRSWASAGGGGHNWSAQMNLQCEGPAALGYSHGVRAMACPLRPALAHFRQRRRPEDKTIGKTQMPLARWLAASAASMAN